MTVPHAPGPHEPEFIDDYRISALLGEGGQGTVYLGEAPDGAQVAIKMLHARLTADPTARRRFLREAEVTASVAAFCTAKVIGTGMAGERPYIVSEYVSGPSLSALVGTDGPRTGSGLERLAVATLTALASIHQAGIVHRDFKPGNVILGPEGPVVIDFGIAHVVDHTTSTGQLAGTPAYMSPEQLTDEPLTSASDMFSWAGTMVFAASGRVPFPGQTFAAILHAILSDEPDLSGVPDPLHPLVAASLAKDPAARPAAGRLLHDLTGGDAGLPRRGRRPVGRSNSRPDGHPLVDPPTVTDTVTPANLSTSADPVAPAGPVTGSKLRPVRGQDEPDSRPTSPSASATGIASPGRRPRGPALVMAAVVAVLVVTSGALFAPTWLGERGSAIRVPTSSGIVEFPDTEVADRFADDTSRQYIPFKPESDEALPTTVVGGGRFTGSGSEPFFGLFGLGAEKSGLPPSGAALSVLTIGTFVESGKQEDSVFVGWVKDEKNYVTAWYNNSRKQSGIDVRVNGEFTNTVGGMRFFNQGDRFALLLSGNRIVSYAESGGTWQLLDTADIGDVLATPQKRHQFRYGFGLRGTSGTIGVTGIEGRSAP
ncbi:serine/threonine-protein kinase [Streptosporangium sp. NPDC051022]|uniref:serine/threonine protein kinase n=1 Tax=Streptosporangium sp. NPDC051022 TaxID=3155752 RepID=UPI003413EF23